jgi:hypothetical protein
MFLQVTKCIKYSKPRDKNKNKKFVKIIPFRFHYLYFHHFCFSTVLFSSNNVSMFVASHHSINVYSSYANIFPFLRYVPFSKYRLAVLRVACFLTNFYSSRQITFRWMIGGGGGGARPRLLSDWSAESLDKIKRSSVLQTGFDREVCCRFRQFKGVQIYRMAWR